MQKYECSDVIIIPKSVFRLMDEPSFVEISGAGRGMSEGSSSHVSILRAQSSNVATRALLNSTSNVAVGRPASPNHGMVNAGGVEFKNSLIAKHWN